MGEPLLRFEDVILHTEGGRRLFSGLLWSVPRGARLRLDPVAGCGCTALLRLAAGIAAPDEGSVVLDGIPFTYGGSHHPSLAKGRVGWVPTSGGLMVNLTLLANVTLPLRAVHGLGKEAAEEQAFQWLDRAGLAPLAAMRPHAFQPSEAWLGALVRCAASGPALWLVDRPPSNLEETMAQRALDILRGGLTISDAAIVVDPPDGWSDLSDIHHLVEGQIRPGSAP